MAKTTKAKKASRKNAVPTEVVTGAAVEGFTAYKVRTSLDAAKDINRLLLVLREHAEAYEAEKMAGTAYTILGNIFDVVGVTIPPAIGAQIKGLMTEAMNK
ncbi:MAG: hypothetical protein K2X45_19260, partial [Phreatobacter sp.]|nr:hypothetical protein [Phreatobacter sp.]